MVILNMRVSKVTLAYPKEYEEAVIGVLGRFGFVELIELREEEFLGFHRVVPAETRHIIVLLDKVEKLAEEYSFDLSEYVDVKKEVEVRKYDYSELANEYNLIEYELRKIDRISEIDPKLEKLEILNKLVKSSNEAADFYRKGGKTILVDALFVGDVEDLLKTLGIKYSKAKISKHKYAFLLAPMEREFLNLVMGFLSKFNIEEVESPKLDIDDDISMAIEKAIKDLREEKQVLNEEFEKKKLDVAKKLARLYRKIEITSKILKAESITLKGEFTAILKCWVPEDKLDDLKRSLAEVIGEKVLVLKEKLRKGEEAPVIVKRPKIVSSWQSLFTQMGYPSPEDIFPWWLVGFLWAFMFGFMFPDIGQGIAIVVMGLIFTKKKEVFGFPGKKLGNLFITAGMFAALFGLLYGEVFLIEVYPPLLPGLVEHWLHVRSSITWVLKYAIVVGIVEILIACILFMYRNIKHGHITEALLGEWGIPGILMYIGIVCLGFYFIGITLLPSIEIFGFKTSPLIFEEKRMAVVSNFANIQDTWPLYVLIFGIVLLMVGGFVEGNLGEKIPALIELPLSMIANTLSFTRLAGFLIGHAAFALVVETFGGASLSNVMLWAMNALVLTLELLVVSLQALRLVFYEFSTKWYVGGSRPLVPFRI